MKFVYAYDLGPFESDRDFPGVVFCKSFSSIKYNISSKGKHIDHMEDMGISLFVPQECVDQGELLHFDIHLSFSGSFEMPEGYESASLLYLIRPSKDVKLKKHVTLRL